MHCVILQAQTPIVSEYVLYSAITALTTAIVFLYKQGEVRHDRQTKRGDKCEEEHRACMERDSKTQIEIAVLRTDIKHLSLNAKMAADALLASKNISVAPVLPVPVAPIPVTVNQPPGHPVPVTEESSKQA